MSKRPTVLMILDGYGLNNNQKGNAVAEAKQCALAPSYYPEAKLKSEDERIAENVHSNPSGGSVCGRNCTEALEFNCKAVAQPWKIGKRHHPDCRDDR